MSPPKRKRRSSQPIIVQEVEDERERIKQEEDFENEKENVAILPTTKEIQEVRPVICD